MKLASFVYSIFDAPRDRIGLFQFLSTIFVLPKLIPVGDRSSRGPVPRAARADDGRGGGASQPAAKMKARHKKVNHKIESESFAPGGAAGFNRRITEQIQREQPGVR
jgi:hypothetical protein